MLEPDPILITIDNVTDVTCFGDGNGSINVTTTGPGPLTIGRMSQTHRLALLKI